MMKSRQIIMAVAALAAGVALGQVSGTIINTSDRDFTGTLRWKESSKAYEVTKDGLTVEVPLANVKEIRVTKPKALADAEKQMRDNPALAIPALEKVAKDYLMLTWDKPATRLLAEAYLTTGKHDDAIRTCETVIKADPPAAYLGEIAPIYWQALMKKGSTSKVEDLIAKAIKSGDRTASAFALIMRGNLILATGETADNARKALKDAYLRVITLYEREREAQPEALYMAARCFEKIGQTQRADFFRSELKRDFAKSEWASKP